MKTIQSSCDTSTCMLCRYCIPEWVPSIERYKKTIRFNKGEQVFKEGESVKGIFFLKEGKIKVHKLWETDKQMIIRFAKPGDVIGHRGLGNNTSYPVSATALENIAVCFIERNFFLQTLQVNPAFNLKLMMFYSDELQDAEKRIRDLALMDVRGRIADTFLMLYNRFGTDDEGYINILLTRHDIASFAGTIYETFFKIAAELVKQKIIRYSGKKVKLLKMEKLQILAKMKS
ncbi:Crp/Fnr family transcriptional regulator [Panacibacter ginsenosidivorans]|uniref:Crp/Fnr family transcriptional regulator n=1 Tax=Panacibacter ginsenosidivorans TaxID=1813871 RepID=A0A5B8V578_9BACT|nr:Crp/Fnr family transcriptional regulator [Panacibacter ginsenosidivorans]QEC66362.1 Crp/Fnr family transcriptional regulator [Panacibacter ginsenosidivorans]